MEVVGTFQDACRINRFCVFNTRVACIKGGGKFNKAVEGSGCKGAPK